MLKNKPSFTTLGRMIQEHELQLQDEVFELDAGDVIWFDAFKNEWVSMGGK